MFRNGKVLLAQRAVGSLAGLWSLPGGRLEFGERLEDCALRELDEEVGVRAEIVDFAGIVEVMPRKQGAQFHFTVIAFAARWVSGEPKTGPEASDIRWAIRCAGSCFPGFGARRCGRSGLTACCTSTRRFPASWRTCTR